ncbi:MAG: hypothetical protein V4619_18040 [Bacteroidota bacterium]
MKHLTRFTTIIALGLVVAVSACKKSDSAANKPADKTDYQALSKHIATSFARSMNVGSTGFKASGGVGGQRALSTGPQCGDVVYTPYNETVTSGDTTRIYTGNSVFTYICNGGVLNEYSLVDTATSRELRTGYASTYRVIQKYNARAIDANYTQTASNGTIGVAFAQRLFNNSGATTDSLSYATQYQLNNVKVTRGSNGGAAITGGEATFASSVYHKDKVVDIDGYSDDHTGYIYFDGNDIIFVTFYQADYQSTYQVNIKTGAVQKVK